jgi:hypothetical protein
LSHSTAGTISALNAVGGVLNTALSLQLDLWVTIQQKYLLTARLK